jgi:hypothetical protein
MKQWQEELSIVFCLIKDDLELGTLKSVIVVLVLRCRGFGENIFGPRVTFQQPQDVVNTG